MRFTLNQLLACVTVAAAVSGGFINYTTHRNDARTTQAIVNVLNANAAIAVEKHVEWAVQTQKATDEFNRAIDARCSR